MSSPSAPSTKLAPGTPAYRRFAAALFLAGYATFSLLYCVQPLLPELARAFAVSPAQSSLALSLATGLLAPSILAAATLPGRWGRRTPMAASMIAAAVLNVLVAAAPDWRLLLALRAAEGLALGGVPAVAMAYVAEEVAPESLGGAMGLYLAGTAFGGMAGRVGVGALVELLSWRWATGVIGALGLAAALAFLRLAPIERGRDGAGLAFSDHRRAWARHLADPALPLVFAIGFLAMGAFVSIYNYAGFRLTAAPYRLSQSALGSIFTVYLFGMIASSVAGRLADRVGRGRVLAAGLAIELIGIAVTLAQPLSAVIGGIALLTIGFFAAHSVASGWVGQLAARDKGHAAALYLFSYYLGSSLVGSGAGWFLAAGGWPLLCLATASLLLLALLCVATVSVRTRLR